MRDINSNHRNAGLAIFGRHNGSDFFVGLKFDCEIDLLAHQKIGVSLRNFRAVSVVQRDEFDTFSSSRSLQTLRYLSRELVIRALGCVTKSVESLLPRSHAGLVQILPNLIDHPTLLKRVEQTKHHGFWQTAARGNLLQRQGFSGGMKCGQELRRVHDRLDEIRIARRSDGAHTVQDMISIFFILQSEICELSSKCLGASWNSRNQLPIEKISSRRKFTARGRALGTRRTAPASRITLMLPEAGFLVYK